MANLPLGVAATMIHAAILLPSFYLVYRCRRHQSMRERSRVLLAFMALGCCATIHVVIPDLNGGTYPCIARVTLFCFCNVFLYSTTLIRLAHIAAMHCKQSRLRTLRRNFSEISPHMLSYVSETVRASINTIRDKPASVTSAHNDTAVDVSISPAEDTRRLAPTTLRIEGASTPVMMHTVSDDAMGTISDANNARPQLKIKIPLVTSEIAATSMTPAPFTPLIHAPAHNATRFHQFLQYVMLDVFSLHRHRGQLVCWAVINVVYVIVTVLEAVGLFGGGSAGVEDCRRSALRSYTFFGYGTALLFLQLMVAVYIRNKADAFGLREELLSLLAICFVGWVVLAVLMGLEGSMHADSYAWYARLVLSWLIVIVCFLRPALKARHLPNRILPEANVPSNSSSCNSPVVVVVSSADTSADASKPGSRPPELRSDTDSHLPADPTNASGWTRGDTFAVLHMLHIMGELSNDEYKHRKNNSAVMALLDWHVKSLDGQHRDHTRTQLNYFTSYFCGTHVGIALLQPVVEREWCAEQLLFITDAVHFHRRLQAFVHVVHHRASPSSILETERALQAFNKMLNAATRLYDIYLRSDGPCPLNTQLSNLTAASRCISSIITTVKASNGRDSFVGENADATVELFVKFARLLASVEREQLQLLAFGPVQRMITPKPK